MVFRNAAASPIAGGTGTMRELRSQIRNTTEEVAGVLTPNSSMGGTPAAEDRRQGEDEHSLGARLSHLTLHSPEPHSSSNQLLSPDYPLPSVESPDPITVRDLPNATPRPTPSPEPMSRPAPAGTDRGVIERLQELGIDDREDKEGEELPSMEQLKMQNAPLPYDVNDEALPPLPFSDRNYQNVLRAGLRLAREIVDCLTQCEVANKSDTQLYKIKQKAELLQGFDCPASRTIGIVGDSAAGKSSLINSLLHLNIAHKGGHGFAVTAFVTEYRKRTHEHHEPFTIEVEFSTLEELHEQIHELLYDYRLLYKPELSEDLGQSSDEYRNIEQRSRLALSTLQSIFPDRRETEASYLRGDWGGTSNRTADDIENDLKILAEGLKTPAGATDGKWQSTAADASKCRDKVANFMANGLWPRTNIVRIYLSAQVLKTGIVLADLPGFRDVNLARVRKAEQYLLKCDEVFVVANINRVVTDESVEKSVENTICGRINRNLRVHNSISIVCTHADDVDIAESEENERELAGLRTTRLAKSALLKAERALTSNIKELETRYKYIYISARNANVRRELHKKYETLIGDTNLKIFCVGNRDYQGYGLLDQTSRLMAVQGSGIPELRRFCHSIVDKAQFRASNHFLGVEIPHLLQSLEVWLAASEQESPPTIPSDCANDLKSELLLKVEQFSEKLQNEFKNQILIPWRKSEVEIETKAIETSGEWHIVHHWATYRALVRNNGTLATAATDNNVVRWNQQVLQRLNDDLAVGWATFDNRLVQQGDDLQTSIQQGFTSLRRQLQDGPQALMSAVNLKELDLNFWLQESFSSFLLNLRTIQYNVTGDHASSLILAKMVPIYRACLLEAGTGRGTMARMYAAMESQMSRRDIFPYIFRQMKTAIVTAINETKNALINQAVVTCASIQQQIDTATGGEVNEASERHPEDLERLQSSMVFFRNSLHEVQEQAAIVRQQAKILGYVQ